MAISWCHIALRQVDRVEESFAAFRATIFPAVTGVRRVTPDSERPKHLYWGDVHFLFVAVNHVTKALDRLPNGPQFPQPLRSRAVQLRHLLEHWWEAADRKGAWKKLEEQHGEFGSPWIVSFDLADLKIGSEEVSVRQLEEVLSEILRELVWIEGET